MTDASTCSKDEGLRPLALPRAICWSVSETQANLVREPALPRPITMQADGKLVTFDLARAALIIVDMQNDFCHPDGWLAHFGVDVAPVRAPIAPLQFLLPPAPNTSAHKVPANLAAADPCRFKIAFSSPPGCEALLQDAEVDRTSESDNHFQQLVRCSRIRSLPAAKSRVYIRLKGSLERLVALG